MEGSREVTCSGLNLDPFRFIESKFPAVRSDGISWRPFQVLLMDAKPEIHISIFSFTDTNTQINYLGGSSYRWYVWFYKWIRLISVCVCLCVSCSVMSDSLSPHKLAHQASLSMDFSRPEHWSGLPFPSPEDLPNPGIEPWSPALQADSLPFELQGKMKSI